MLASIVVAVSLLSMLFLLRPVTGFAVNGMAPSRVLLRSLHGIGSMKTIQHTPAVHSGSSALHKWNVDNYLRSMVVLSKESLQHIVHEVEQENDRRIQHSFAYRSAEFQLQQDKAGRTTVISPEDEARLLQDVENSVKSQLDILVSACERAACETLMDTKPWMYLKNERDGVLNARKVALLQEVLERELAISLPGVKFRLRVPNIFPPYHVPHEEQGGFSYDNLIYIGIKLSWR